MMRRCCCYGYLQISIHKLPEEVTEDTITGDTFRRYRKQLTLEVIGQQA